MSTQCKILSGIAAGCLFSFLASNAQAATFFLTPPTVESGVGEKITVDVKIDGAGASFNAAQATIRFPKETLQVLSLDKTGSAFSFWLEDPNFSNTDGVISFTGGTPYGVSGSAIQILKIVFTAKGSGEAGITLQDAAITASDGSGTNILSALNNAAVTVSPTRTNPRVPSGITREAVSSERLPEKPAIKISLYPDPGQWYNVVSAFSASWDLPADISSVSTALNKTPVFIPPAATEGLFDNKNFDALSDGVWYFHVRFRNNIGWGPAADYRVAIDTQPPAGFEIVVPGGESADNPSPTLQFKTSDAFSGLREYQLRIGDGDVIKIASPDFNGTYTLPLQAPGKHRVVVRAVDQADNSVENSVVLDILPIASPAITFVPSSLFSDEGSNLTVRGTAPPNINVIVLLHSGDALAERGIAHSDEKGNWEFAFGQPFRNGLYRVSAQSQDARGALSIAVDSSEITIKSKPIIQIGSFQLGMGGALIFLLLVIAGGFVGGFWFYKTRQEKLGLRLWVVQTDMAKVFTMIRDDVEKLRQARTMPSQGSDDFIMNRLQENMKKMEAYLKKEIEKIK